MAGAVHITELVLLTLVTSWHEGFHGFLPTCQLSIMWDSGRFRFGKALVRWHAWEWYIYTAIYLYIYYSIFIVMFYECCTCRYFPKGKWFHFSMEYICRIYMACIWVFDLYVFADDIRWCRSKCFKYKGITHYLHLTICIEDHWPITHVYVCIHKLLWQESKWLHKRLINEPKLMGIHLQIRQSLHWIEHQSYSILLLKKHAQ